MQSVRFEFHSDIIDMDEPYNRYEISSRFQFVVNNCMRKDSSQ